MTKSRGLSGLLPPLSLHVDSVINAETSTCMGGGGVYTPHDSPITKIKFVNSPITKNAEPFHQSPRIITDHQSPRISISVVLKTISLYNKYTSK